MVGDDGVPVVAEIAFSSLDQVGGGQRAQPVAAVLEFEEARR